MYISRAWLVAVLFTSTANAADVDNDGCEDAQFDANGACVAESTTTTVNTIIGADAIVGEFVELDDVFIAPSAVLGGWDSHSTQPLPVGDFTVVGRRTVIGVDHIIGSDSLFSRSVVAGPRLTTGTGSSVGYAAQLGSDVTLDDGAVVGNLVGLGDYTYMGPNAIIGRGTTVADASSLGERSEILGVVGPDVTIGSNVSVASGARVRKQATLMSGAEITSSARVGRDAIIGQNTTVHGTVRALGEVCDGDTVGANETIARGTTSRTPLACPPPPVCDITFVDETATRGLPTTTNGASSAVFVDIDNDGDQDVFLRGSGLFLNDGSGQFTDVTGNITPAPNLALTMPTSIGDINGDGFMDIFIGNNTRNVSTFQNRLYLNDGTGVFSDVGATYGVQLVANQARTGIFFDHDGDGDLDLTYVNEFNQPAQWRNDGTPPFGDDKTLFTGHNMQGDAGSWVDFDDDGDFDLLISAGNSTAKLFVNNGSTWAQEAASRGLVSVGSRMGGVTWVDLDGDLDLDLHLVVNSTNNDFYYINDGGQFTRHDYSEIGLGDGSQLGAAAIWGDYDRDGDLDAYLPQSGLYDNDGGTFSSRSELNLPVAQSGAWGDVNGDGRLDLLTAFPERLFVQHIPSGCSDGGFIQVRALTDSSGGNSGTLRDAIGARIIVDLDGDGDFAAGPSDSTEIYLVGSAQGGNASQSQIAPLIGVGSAATVDVLVRFRDGTEVTTLDVAAGSRIDVLDLP